VTPLQLTQRRLLVDVGAIDSTEPTAHVVQAEHCVSFVGVQLPDANSPKAHAEHGVQRLSPGATVAAKVPWGHVCTQAPLERKRDPVQRTHACGPAPEHEAQVLLHVAQRPEVESANSPSGQFDKQMPSRRVSPRTHDRQLAAVEALQVVQVWWHGVHTVLDVALQLPERNWSRRHSDERVQLVQRRSEKDVACCDTYCQESHSVVVLQTVNPVTSAKKSMPSHVAHTRSLVGDGATLSTEPSGHGARTGLHEESTDTGSSWNVPEGHAWHARLNVSEGCCVMRWPWPHNATGLQLVALVSSW